MNAEQVPYYLEKMREAYFDKQKSNAAFSLRSYARYLGIQAPSLSAILRNKRRLPVKAAHQVMDKLNLTPNEKRRFRDSLYEHSDASTVKSQPSNAHILRSEEYYKIIAEWEHYAILILLETQGAKSDPEWLAKRLNITKLRAEDVLQRLLSAGLLKQNKGKFVPTHENITTTEDVSSSALQKSHFDNLLRAKAALENIPLNQRDYSSITLAMDMKKIEEAKKLIRNFRKQMATLVENSNSNEVYELSIQLFPVTNTERKPS